MKRYIVVGMLGGMALSERHPERGLYFCFKRGGLTVTEFSSRKAAEDAIRRTEERSARLGIDAQPGMAIYRLVEARPKPCR